MNQFIKFGMVGLLSTLIDICVLKLLLLMHVPLLAAGAVGFFAGFSNGYYFNSKYVFQKGSSDQYARYLGVSVVGLGLTELILYIGHHVYDLPELAAKLIAVGLVFFSNFFLSKLWAFK